MGSGFSRHKKAAKDIYLRERKKGIDISLTPKTLVEVELLFSESGGGRGGGVPTTGLSDDQAMTPTPSLKVSSSIGAIRRFFLAADLLELCSGAWW